MTDHEILIHIRAGDQQVLEKVYVQHREPFISWLKKQYNCSKEEGQEIYQVTFYIFYENVLTGKLQYLTSSIKTYLFGIGKYKILEHIRVESKKAYEIREEYFQMEEEQTFPDLDQENMIISALRTLGDPCKKLLELVYYENRSMEDIAHALNYKNPDTAKNQKYKCMQRLKKLVMTTNV
ncbi:hypothetical protein GCM10007049_28590 [Echinicola pacifica]|uniref:RNA polymerase sigma factor, sigma-70 family n=1 Tax=Echinicola pacifica TaxID=346377 RepID=A0A918UTT0_9BACT|nr:sigma-70 family RNA polymerase sigma factor [Echinicola pacifica]GGZ33225.1 hypothetical protein GCM10007049_28590 [Echinicola pacifica]